jgi:uncharacterized protein (UPF0335 family)
MGEIIKDTFDGALVYVRPELGSLKVDPESVMDHDKIMESVQKARKTMNNVLGVIEGVYFVPNGYSRNKRFYPKELWEEVLKKVVPTLDKKAMVGTLEHPTSEEAAHPKNASHVVKKLYIGKDGKGYGKSYILNTPMGSLVYVLGSARDEEGNPIVPLYMSSRGLGKLSGYTRDGYEIVDPKSYILESFDVVLDPGFVDAKPALNEVVESVLPEIKRMEEGRESFFISLLESVSSLTLEDEPSSGYDGPPSGFISDEPSPIQESPVLEGAYRELGLGVVEVIQETGDAPKAPDEVPEGVSFDFTPVPEGLSEGDLRSFVSIVEQLELGPGGTQVLGGESSSLESYAGPSAQKPPESTSSLSQSDLVLLLEGYKNLVDKVRSLEEEIKSLKVELVSSSSGVSPSKARKLLESNGWDVSRVRSKLPESKGMGEKFQERKKRHAETLESVTVESTVESRVTSHSPDTKNGKVEEAGVLILESLLNRM